MDARATRLTGRRLRMLRLLNPKKRNYETYNNESRFGRTDAVRAWSGRAFVEQMLTAYDTEKRLQAQALAPAFSIEDLVIEAGPTFFDSAVKQVSEGIESITGVLAERTAAPYVSATK
jgi:hypothetical protein